MCHLGIIGDLVRSWGCKSRRWHDVKLWLAPGPGVGQQHIFKLRRSCQHMIGGRRVIGIVF